MFERCTDGTIKVMKLAQEETRLLGHNFVGSEQILLGLLGEGSGIAAKELRSKGINLKDARIEVEKIIGRGSGFVAAEIPLTPRAKQILEFAEKESKKLGHDCVETQHLLLGILNQDKGVAIKVLGNLEIDAKKMKEELVKLMGEQATGD